MGDDPRLAGPIPGNVSPRGARGGRRRGSCPGRCCRASSSCRRSRPAATASQPEHAQRRPKSARPPRHRFARAGQSRRSRSQRQRAGAMSTSTPVASVSASRHGDNPTPARAGDANGAGSIVRCTRDPAMGPPAASILAGKGNRALGLRDADGPYGDRRLAFYNDCAIRACSKDLAAFPVREADCRERKPGPTMEPPA